MVGFQLSLRKAFWVGVVVWVRVGVKGAGGRLITAGNSPPKAIRAISTSIICLMESALSIRYP